MLNYALRGVALENDKWVNNWTYALIHYGYIYYLKKKKTPQDKVQKSCI